MKRLALILAMLIFAPAAADAQGPPDLFQQGVAAYNAGRYQAAAEKFGALVQAGIRNGALYYNLGNTHLKQGDLGRAILWYERAERLIPRDPDLQFNLAHARSLTQDQPEERPSPLVDVAFFLTNLASPKTVQIAAVAAMTLLFGALILRLLIHHSLISLMAALGALLVLLTLPSAGYQLHQDQIAASGVVLADELPVRAGRGVDTAKLFTLHAGSLVRIEGRRDDYYRINYDRGKIGWVPAGDVGRI
jgi:tetratricopeptide (TPR) repeat protein